MQEGVSRITIGRQEPAVVVGLRGVLPRSWEPLDRSTDLTQRKSFPACPEALCRVGTKSNVCHLDLTRLPTAVLTQGPPGT